LQLVAETQAYMEVIMEIVSSTFATHEAAESAVRAIGETGTPLKNISIVAQNLQTTERIQGFITTGDIAKEGASIGAWWGGMFGTLTGAAFLWIPVVGPLVVAGPVALAFLGLLEGAAVGAVGGGLLGALVGYGFSDAKALKYETSVRSGQYLVLFHGDKPQASEAKAVLLAQGAENLEVSTRAA
jgi:outer membrane lipoprotein SlyB